MRILNNLEIIQIKKKEKLRHVFYLPYLKKCPVIG